MTRTSLSESEFELLRVAVREHVPEMLPRLVSLGAVPLSEVEREQLRSAVANELCASGVDDDEVVNERGVLLDRLIDRLGHL